MEISENKYSIGDELFFLNHNGAMRKGVVYSIEFNKYISDKKNQENWYYNFQYKDKTYHPYGIIESQCSTDPHTLAEIQVKEYS